MELLSALGGVPKMLVWDNESGVGQHHRLTLPARSFAGTLGTRIYQTAARAPEAKGMVERANGFLQTSFMPGRTFTCGADFNSQLQGWLPRANTRLVRATAARPVDLVGADRAAMGALPPITPVTGTATRVRLARDYYVRIGGSDYSVDPQVIGRFVDVEAGLDRVKIRCERRDVGDHQRQWAPRQVVTDPVHVTVAAELRTAFKERTCATRGPAPTTEVAMRSLSDYDDLFALNRPEPGIRPYLQVAR